jgi:hypothetical protein
VEPGGQTRYDLLEPFVECPFGALRRLGGAPTEDGGKWLCTDGLLNAPGCIIYSLGSNGNYGFEQAMLQERKT